MARWASVVTALACAWACAYASEYTTVCDGLTEITEDTEDAWAALVQLAEQRDALRSDEEALAMVRDRVLGNADAAARLQREAHRLATVATELEGRTDARYTELNASLTRLAKHAETLEPQLARVEAAVDARAADVAQLRDAVGAVAAVADRKERVESALNATRTLDARLNEQNLRLEGAREQAERLKATVDSAVGDFEMLLAALNEQMDKHGEARATLTRLEERMARLKATGGGGGGGGGARAPCSPAVSLCERYRARHP